MKKLALAFSSKDRVELTKQTLAQVSREGVYLFWNDGSATNDGKFLHLTNPRAYRTELRSRVTGGPDRAIVFALSQMLSGSSYTHVGLLENDVLLDEDWLEPTMRLFDYSTTEGLPVGAASARAYEDRVLIQRDGYAIMHNVGAGHVIFTREAAQIVLANYRTGWWPENRAVFSQLSGIDIGKYAAFGFNEQMITADWSWDTILAAHGLATVALTPSKATMIGQDLTMEQQGLKYADGRRVNFDVDIDPAFDLFRSNLIDIRAGKLAPLRVDHNLNNRNGILTFPHHMAKLGAIFRGKWTSRWSQGFGPFIYVAKEQAGLSIPVFGACAFQVGSGRVSVKDDATGFTTDLDLSGNDEIVALPVPREYQTGTIHLEFGEGACLAGIETLHPQPQRLDAPFDFSKLPEVG